MEFNEIKSKIKYLNITEISKFFQNKSKLHTLKEYEEQIPYSAEEYAELIDILNGAINEM